MNLDKLQSKLLAAARSVPADERVPYAYCGRVMARLRGPGPEDGWSLWSRALWKAAAASVALSLALGFWSFASMNDPLPVSLESTLVSMAEQLSDSW